jgi:putative endonuclease
MLRRPYAVYILTNPRHTTLYIGVTRDLVRRLHQHRAGTGSAFVRRYHLDQLVYVEFHDEARFAIEREKQLKAGNRARKVALIERANPEWRDLSRPYLG